MGNYQDLVNVQKGLNDSQKDVGKVKKDIPQKRQKGNNGLIINEWEELTAPSYRRLSVKSLDTPIKIKWSIDRITIVGKLQEEILVVQDDGKSVIYINFEQLMNLKEGQGNLTRISYNSWQLSDNFGENIAFIEMLKFQKGYGRIDFNPNKINQFLADSMKIFIHRLFLDPHFSRADIACDILDIPTNFISQYTVIDPVSFRPYYGLSGELETAYWGSRSSERQIRLYNKLLEQNRKRKVLPKEIKYWWRLELQLRRAKAKEWHRIVNESLDSFVSPRYLPLDLKPTDKIMIDGLFSNHENWSILSRTTKYKYKKLLKETSINDELTQLLKLTFAESSDELKKELDTWLLGLEVKEEEEEETEKEKTKE